MQSKKLSLWLSQAVETKEDLLNAGGWSCRPDKHTPKSDGLLNHPFYKTHSTWNKGTSSPMGGGACSDSLLESGLKWAALKKRGTETNSNKGKKAVLVSSQSRRSPTGQFLATILEWQAERGQGWLYVCGGGHASSSARVAPPPSL